MPVAAFPALPTWATLLTALAAVGGVLLPVAFVGLRTTRGRSPRDD